MDSRLSRCKCDGEPELKAPYGCRYNWVVWCTVCDHEVWLDSEEGYTEEDIISKWNDQIREEINGLSTKDLFDLREYFKIYSETQKSIKRFKCQI